MQPFLGLISFNEARMMAELEPVKQGDKFAWEIQTQNGQTIFDTISKDTKQKPGKITSKLKETYYNTQVNTKPRTRVCGNCKSFKPVKRWCGLNSFPVEKGDSCARFEKSDKQENK